MPDLTTQLCFRRGTFSGADYVNLIKQGIGFDPTYISTSHFNVAFAPYMEEDLDIIGTYGPELNLTLTQEGLSVPSFAIVEPAHRMPPQVVQWALPDTQMPNSRQLEDLMGHPNFVVGYAYDKDDVTFQSAERVSIYQVKNRSYEHVRLYYNDYWKEQLIDISGNPGRKKLVCGMWLMSCWRMWFGSEYFEHVSKNHLLAFPDAHEVREEDNGVVFIELYKNPHEADVPENRRVQQAFRDWVKMDKMEQELA